MRRPRWFFGVLTPLCAFLVLSLTGCAGVSESRLKANEATCEVCRYNNDLACVCVQVREGTPRTEYNGHSYYFCSEECRAAFCKKPEKYLPKSISAHKSP